MDLAGALGLEERALVAFVGAGGKKTAMARLAGEAGRRDVTAGYTTTTHVPPPDDLPLVVAAPEALEVALDGYDPPVAFAREWVEQPERADRKLRGFEPAVVDWTYRARLFDWLLVKADGARRRPFKAPGPDEPAMPAAATHVVPVASVGVVGEPLTDEHVHRVDRAAAVAGLSPGETIDTTAVGTVLASPEGGCKDVPPGADVVPIVNQADTTARRETARRVLAHAFEATDRLDRGLVTSFEADYCAVVTAAEVG
ncbi:MAG: selenium cofactor biosynthesis protein YqeC [Halobacteriales archaeon]